MFWYVLLAFLLLFVALILIRTFRFVPWTENASEPEPVTFDRDAAVNALSELVRCRTVSCSDAGKEDSAEFEKLISKLPVLYPHVFDSCSFERLPDRALLFTWKGREAGPAAVLMAHYDVVPVSADQWTRPPFEAVIADGAMWGRGTIDTKNTLNGILSAANTLIAQGFVPKNDIYFAFSGGEEINGNGALNIVNRFAEQGIELSMVLDEGGAVVQNVFPGVKQPCGLIGIAEKGMMTMNFTVSSSGGHASAPSPHTPVGVLSAACVKLENHPFKSRFTKPVLEMFDTLGRHSGFVYRMIFANLWCFGPVLDSFCKKSGGELNALVRTTVAFTQMTGSDAPNVIPPVASMAANIRLNPGDTIESATEYVRSVIGDDSITLSSRSAQNPSRISSTDCEGWFRVRNAVRDTWKGCIVAPYLMVQCSDSRHYSAISDKVYRFSAADLTAEERHSIHGNDEHIRLETIARAVEFFIRVIRAC